MEKGKTRRPTCARCRNHGNPNVLIKNHGNVCPWKKDHGPECKLGCALIIERHKVNEEIKKNVRSKNSGKRNHTGNRKKDEAKVAKTMSSSTAAKRERNNLCAGKSVDTARAKKRAPPNVTAPSPEGPPERFLQQQWQHALYQLQVMHPVQQLPPYYCMYPCSSLSPMSRPQNLYRHPNGIPWVSDLTRPEHGYHAEWSQYQPTPYQVPVFGSPQIRAPLQPSPHYTMPQ